MILPMDTLETFNGSCVSNVNEWITIEKDAHVINSAASLRAADNITVQMPDVLQELNRNMTMAVLPVTVFIGFEAFIGFFGNILILMIYSKKYERSNFRYFVLSMAVIDLTSCCSTLPGEIFSQINWYDYEYDWICKLKSYMNVLTAWGSASILMLMAFDRYRKVCKPLAWQIQTSCALKLCFASGVVSALVASPIAVLWGKQSYVLQHYDQNITVSICEKSGQYANGIYPLVYICSVYIIPVGIMVIVVCFLNILTAKSLFRRNLSIDLSKQNYFSSSRSTINTSVDNDLDLDSSGVTHSNSRSCDTIITSIANINEISDSDDANVPVEKDGRAIEATSGIIHEYQRNGDRAYPVNCSKTSKNDGARSNGHLTEEVTNGYINQSQNNCCSPSSENYTNHEPIDTKDICLEMDENVNTDTKRGKVSNGELCEIGHKDGSNQNGNDIRCSNCKRRKTSDRTENIKKRKTVIMLILTSFFLITMSMYVILITFVAEKDGILKNSSNSEKVIFFFFWRLYFSNTIVNPLLYGFLDPRFRSGLRSLFNNVHCLKKQKQRNKFSVRSRNRRPIFTLH